MPKKYQNIFLPLDTTKSTSTDKDQEWSSNEIDKELEHFEQIFELIFINKHFHVLFKLSQPEIQKDFIFINLAKSGDVEWLFCPEKILKTYRE